MTFLFKQTALIYLMLRLHSSHWELSGFSLQLKDNSTCGQEEPEIQPLILLYLLRHGHFNTPISSSDFAANTHIHLHMLCSQFGPPNVPNIVLKDDRRMTMISSGNLFHKQILDRVFMHRMEQNHCSQLCHCYVTVVRIQMKQVMAKIRCQQEFIGKQNPQWMFLEFLYFPK